MKGYKAFNKDLTCRGMQYEVGKTYEMVENPVCCERGFHFCKNMKDVYKFYDMSDDTRICEVYAIGEIVTNDDIKYCTNKIKIIREIKNKGIKHCNIDKTDVGYYNSGYCNSGNYNSGDYNSGDCNSGNRNSGNYNSGDYNSGYYNSGYCNSGNRNSGDYNSGDYNSGYCNTDTPKVRLFNHETDISFYDDRIYRLRNILSSMPSSYVYSDYIRESEMSDEEKNKHPEYNTIGGYIKTIKIDGNKWKWWNEEVSDNDKEFIKSLPYYDEDIFFESTGIKADMNK